MNGNSFDYHYKGVTYHVEFDLCGPSGTGDEQEIENLQVTTEDDITDLLPAEVINHIESACFEHLPDGPEAEPEEDR